MLKLKDGMELGKLNVLGDSSFSSKPKVNGNDIALSNEIPIVNNATLTIQKNGTNVATFTANASSDSTINITVPTGAAADKGVVTTIDTSANLPTSNAVKTFVESKGYLTGITSSQVTSALGFTPYNATNPNGYLTSTSTLKEAYLSWGGKSLSDSISPIDAACSNIHSANRFAFAKPAGITIEYSTNGSTYSTYSTTDSAKINLVSGIGQNYYIGARSTSTTVNDKLRITLNATNMGIYTRLQKLLLNISTNYASGSNVTIERAMKGSETTFTKMGTYDLSGWSGWNSIPIGYAFGGGTTQTGNIAVLRLTFGITGINSSQTSNALQLIDIVGIGDTYWAYNSNMAKTGHIYSYNATQNATFPASVTASSFKGSEFYTTKTYPTVVGQSYDSRATFKLSTLERTGQEPGALRLSITGNYVTAVSGSDVTSQEFPADYDFGGKGVITVTDNHNGVVYPFTSGFSDGFKINTARIPDAQVTLIYDNWGTPKESGTIAFPSGALSSSEGYLAVVGRIYNKSWTATSIFSTIPLALFKNTSSSQMVSLSSYSDNRERNFYWNGSGMTLGSGNSIGIVKLYWVHK